MENSQPWVSEQYICFSAHVLQRQPRGLSATITRTTANPQVTQQDDAIGSRLSRIEARLARIEELLVSTGAGEGQNPSATQEQCYEAWIHYLNNTPEAVEAHLTAHEMAALKASINAQVPSDS